MNLSQWQAECPGRLYAIIDAALAPSAIGRFYETGGEDAFPLFAGTAFAEQAPQGPWLLPFPSTAFIDTYPQLCGFYIISEAPVERVRNHWQSLIEVAYEGEVMWLRFADQRVFPNMLGTMSQSELDEVLGPCAGLWANGETWFRSHDAEFTPRQAPWFRIHPHHLAALYDESRHAYILHRRLWQTMPAMMERHSDPAAAIPPILQQANLDGLDGAVRDGVVAGGLTRQADMPMAAIRTPMLLTPNELAQVASWLDKNNELIGVP